MISSPSALSLALAIPVCLLSLWDAYFTEHRLRKYGVGVELNSLVVWLAEHCGIDLAIALGVTAPSIVLAALGVTFDLTGFLAFLLGVKVITARFQWISLKFEPAIDKHRATLKAQSQDSESQARSASMADPSQPHDPKGQ